MAPSDVRGAGAEGGADNELYIFTHPDIRGPFERRVDRVLAAYRKLGPAPQEIMQ
jgi:hypothetical protein